MHHATPVRRALALLALALALAAGAAEAQSWRTITSARQAHGEKALDVEMEYAAGSLTVSPARSPLLYQLRMRYDENQFSPVTEYAREGGRLRVGLEGRDRKGPRVKKIDEESRATLQLSPDVPVALALRFGAGEADVKLGGMAIRRLRVSTGASETRVSFASPNRIAAESVRLEAGAASFRATGLGNARAEHFEFSGGVGETTLDFDGAWARNASANVRMGVGSVKLRFPRGLGVKVVRQSFLTSFDGDGLVKRGGAYYSRNWENAPHRLTVTIEAALGSIDVDWID